MLLLPLLLLAGATASEPPLLLAPQSSVFQFTIGVSVPIQMDKRGGLVSSTGFQFNYALPWNASQLEPLVVHARGARAAEQLLSLADVYESLEDLLERSGWGSGRACLLRTICELAEAPLARDSRPRSQDVVEEIIHLLLTRPSEETKGLQDSSSQSSASSSIIGLYEEAERVGSSGGDCSEAYGACSESPLDSFTEIAFG